MKKAKHNIVYKVKNMVNGKVYFGAHQTDVLEDGYLGSGNLIKRAVKKYGKNNFCRTVLFDFSTPEEMFEKEKEIVHQEFVKNQNNYNIRTGGSGFYFAHDNFCKHAITPEYKIKVSLALLKVKEGNIPQEVELFESCEYRDFVSVLWNLRDEKNEFAFSAKTFATVLGIKLYEANRIMECVSVWKRVCQKITPSFNNNRSPIYKWLGNIDNLKPASVLQKESIESLKNHLLYGELNDRTRSRLDNGEFDHITDAKTYVRTPSERA